MLQLNISLTTLAVILWSGMMVIAGSIWVLCSQVRKVADLLEHQGRREASVRTRRVGGLRQAVREDAQARLDEIYAVHAN